ncbi:uncharacterized protein FFMR_04821 [Fusarium fujikuroi]|nr:uncharacterized protein FFMR_04821 [Fusarium fujikuroi]
MASYLQAN